MFQFFVKRSGVEAFGFMILVFVMLSGVETSVFMLRVLSCWAESKHLVLCFMI